MKKIVMAVLVGLIALPAAADFLGDPPADMGQWLGGKRLDENQRLQCEFREYKSGKPTTFWNPSYRHGLSPVCPNDLARVAWGWHVPTQAQKAYGWWKDSENGAIFKNMDDTRNEAKGYEYNTLELYAPDGNIVSVYKDAYVAYMQRHQIAMSESYDTFIKNNTVRTFILSEYNPNLQALYKSYADHWTPPAKARYTWLPPKL